MEILNTERTKLNNTIELIGEPSENNILIVGVVHGDEPQGKYLIEEYLKTHYNYTSNSDLPPSSKSKISVLPPREDKKLAQLARTLRNNMTVQEIRIWQYLKNRQIDGVKFRRQFILGKYICDFVSLENKIVIEIDGSQHIESNSDLQRDEFLKSIGFKVLRFWNNDIDNNIEGVISKIKNVISQCPPLEGGPKSPISRRGRLFIPCLNPDGLQLNRRTNANNVDINRNFPTKNWGKNEGDNATCDDETTNYFGGKSAGGEIETRFLIDTINKYTPNLVMTIHAPYKVVNYDGPAKEIAEKISNIIKYPVEASIGYPTPGSFGTWAGVERDIPTITLEVDEKIQVQQLVKPVFEIFDYLIMN